MNILFISVLWECVFNKIHQSLLWKRGLGVKLVTLASIFRRIVVSYVFSLLKHGRPHVTELPPVPVYSVRIAFVPSSESRGKRSAKSNSKSRSKSSSKSGDESRSESRSESSRKIQNDVCSLWGSVTGHSRARCWNSTKNQAHDEIIFSTFNRTLNFHKL